jgi:hypothetical protein
MQHILAWQCLLRCGLWTGAWVREHSNENSDVPIDNTEQLYRIIQQRQTKSLFLQLYEFVILQ